MERARKRILFIGEAVTLAHIGRPLALAAALPADTYECHFACDPRATWAVTLPTTQIHALNSLSSATFLDRLDRGRPVYTSEELSRYVSDDLHLIDKVRPDLIVGDFRLSLSVSARLKHVPYAAISNAHWSPAANQLLPHPWPRLARLAGEPLAQRIFDFVAPLGFYLHARPLNAVRRRHQFDRLPMDVRSIYTDADYVLYDDIPELIPIDAVPANHYFLGPLTWNPPAPLPSWWVDVPLERPIVYVTFGHSGADGLLARTLAALAALRVTVIAATSGRPAAMSASSRLFAADFIAGDAAAQRASLVISNGGSGTSKQALKAGRPLLGIVSNMDQHLGMRAIARRGAGVLLTQQASVAAIQNSIQHIFDHSSYTEAARSIAREFETYNVGERFEKFVASAVGKE